MRSARRHTRPATRTAHAVCTRRRRVPHAVRPTRLCRTAACRACPRRPRQALREYASAPLTTAGGLHETKHRKHCWIRMSPRGLPRHLGSSLRLALLSSQWARTNAAIAIAETDPSAHACMRPAHRHQSIDRRTNPTIRFSIWPQLLRWVCRTYRSGLAADRAARAAQARPSCT